MKSQIATNIEQSKQLLSCGVDPKTADMCWTQRTHRIDGTPIKKTHQKANLWLGYPCKRFLEDDEQRIDTPAWSMSALLGLLPNLIMAENRKQFTFCLCKCKTAYIVAYGDENTDLYQSNGATALEACVRMIETLTSNKHSLNKIEE